MIIKIQQFSSLTVLFLMGRQGHFSGDKDQISSGEGKRTGYQGVWGEAQNEVFLAKFPLLSKIQTLSEKMLVRQTSNHHHCNWHAKKPLCRDFQVILNSSSWSKTALFIVKKQIWLLNRKCYGKKYSFDSLSLNREALSPSFSLNTLCR